MVHLEKKLIKFEFQNYFAVHKYISITCYMFEREEIETTKEILQWRFQPSQLGAIEYTKCISAEG